MSTEVLATTEPAAEPTVQEPDSRRVAWGSARLGVAALTATALVTQLVYELQKAAVSSNAYGHDPVAVVGDFLGTFTYWTCMLLTAALVLSAATVLRRGREPRWMSIVFVACSANVFFVGVFFNLFLRHTIPPDSILWINEVIHVVVPLYALADALLGHHRVVYLLEAVPAAVPGIVWTTYTQVRGPGAIDRATGELGWYAYTFTDPRFVPGGVIGAVTVCAILTAIITGIALCSIAIARRLRSARERAGSAISRFVDDRRDCTDGVG